MSFLLLKIKRFIIFYIKKKCFIAGPKSDKDGRQFFKSPFIKLYKKIKLSTCLNKLWKQQQMLPLGNIYDDAVLGIKQFNLCSIQHTQKNLPASHLAIVKMNHLHQ